MRIKIISYLLLTSLTFQNFSFFSLQRTTQKNNALKEFVMLQSGNNHKEKKSTLDVQEQKQCILKIDAGGKNFIIFDSPNLELFVVELLKKASAQQRQYHLSEDLLQVCQKVLDKQKKFSLQEIAKALPEMLSFALAKIEETKAPLLDAPGLQDGSAECDVDQAMQLLNQLINIVIQCCNTLQVDFAGTFTFLTTILPEINGTFTVLDEIINTLTIDFNGTFTALIDIKNTLTIDFNGTFTALEACCEAIFFDFNGVFTTLTDIDNTVIVDFNGTFTTLDDLKNTMTTDFNETFTALQACCEATFEDFNGTFTALEVIYKTIDGVKCEPMEYLVVDILEEHQGVIMEKLGKKKAEMKNIHHYENGRMRLEFEVPSRGLLGFRSQFLTDTRGTGLANFTFLGYQPYKGDIPTRTKGALVSMESGPSTGFALDNLQARGTLFIGPAEDIYEGMIIGENSREGDMDVNPCKQKKLTNMRASGSDDMIKLTPPKIMELEACMEWIMSDELIEVTPHHIRLRKKILKANVRK